MELELEEGGAGGAELLRGMLKKIFFVPVVVTNRDKRVSFVPVARPGTKEFALLSWHGVPGWETGTKKVSQPGQIKVFVVVNGLRPTCHDTRRTKSKRTKPKI